MKYVTYFARVAALSLAGAGLGGAALAQDELAYLGTSLFGEHTVGHEGAGEDASGDFSAELDFAKGRMCYALEVEGLDDVTAAHIHEGAKDKNGPPVVTLELMGEDGDDICTDVDPALMRKMVKNKSRYYVNVHTAAIPEGAIRGQLDE